MPVIKAKNLKKHADDWFSKYIRARDADRLMDDDGKMRPAGKCITCERVNLIHLMDAGHFISRSCTPLRYDEQNVNLQCKYCNGPKAGEQYKHGKAILEKYGGEARERLLEIEQEAKGKIHQMKRFMYEEIIDTYKEKYKAERKLNKETL